MSRPLTPQVAKLMQQGLELLKANRFLESARAFERAVQRMPDFADAHCLRADALMRAGKIEQARACAERAVRLRPDWGDAWVLRGNLEAFQDRFAEAETMYRQAIALMGSRPELHANLAQALEQQGRLEEALAEYERALAKSDGAAIKTGRASLLVRMGLHVQAEQAWREILDRDPDSREAMKQLLDMYLRAGRIEDVEEICARAAARGLNEAVFRLGGGLALWGRQQYDRALEVFQDAGRMAWPTDKEVFYEATLNEAFGLLKLGRFREGWGRYCQRIDRAALRQRYARLVEDPVDFGTTAKPSRIRVHREQGIGDELFFLRFAPALVAQGHKLLCGTNPKLIPVLAPLEGLFEWVGDEDAPDAPAGEVDFLTSDLAAASGQETVKSLQFSVNRIRRDALIAVLEKFGPPPYIGVTWRAGSLPSELGNARGNFWSKSVPSIELGRCLRSVRGTVVLLQRRPDPNEKEAFHEGLGRGAVDLSNVNDDLEDALGLLSLLDEYVCVSNTNVHLIAGLPSKRARVLVGMPSEWRWGLRQATSPWFADFPVYRQADDRSWDEALRKLVYDLGAPHNS